MFDYPADYKQREEIAERYDRLNANLWLAERLAERITTDLADLLGDRDPFRDYCNGRISRRYFLSLHPAALHLTIVRGQSLRLISEIERRETEIRLSDADRDTLQHARRDFTNLTIDEYPKFISHIMSHPIA
jgi:hypothetical protein